MSDTEGLGTWWPANPSDEGMDYHVPDETVAGMLKTAEPRSWELTTVGGIDPQADMFVPSGLPEHRAIWGADAQGKSISLLDPYPDNYTIHLSNLLLRTEKWGFACYAVGGAWVTPDSVVERLHLPFDGLDDWVVGSMSSDSDLVSTDEEWRKFERPPRLSHDVELGTAQVRLITDSEGNASGRGFSFNRFALFEIVDSIQLDQVFDKWIEPLSLFVSFVTGIPASLGTIQFWQHELDRWPLELHYDIAKSRDLHNQNLASRDYIAPLPSIVSSGLSFDSLLRTFFLLCEDDGNRTALRYLSASQSSVPDGSTEATLHSAFKAAEQYHRTNMNSQSLPSVEHQNRVESVVASAPAKHRDWAKQTLSGRNHKGQKSQLRELQGSAASTSESLSKACPVVFEEMTTYRNRIAHGAPTTRTDLNLRYHLAAKTLRWLLRHVYLVKLGLSPEAVTEIIQESRRFQKDIRLLEAWHPYLRK